MTPEALGLEPKKVRRVREILSISVEQFFRFCSCIKKRGRHWIWTGPVSTGPNSWNLSPKFIWSYAGVEFRRSAGRLMLEFRLGRLLKWGPNFNYAEECCHDCKVKLCLKCIRVDSQLNNVRDRKRDRTNPEGERNACAKLTANQVKEARKLHKQDPKKWNYVILAGRYKVDKWTINNAINRRTWKCVE